MVSDWLWQIDAAAGAFARLNHATDLTAAVPISASRGGVSFRAEIFQEDSRRSDGPNISMHPWGVRAQAALEPFNALRVYAGAADYLGAIPTPGRWTLQAGSEFSTNGMTRRYYFAEDVQFREWVGFNPDWNVVAGVRFGTAKDFSRALRAQVGFYAGHSPYGQFYSRRENGPEAALIFEL